MRYAQRLTMVFLCLLFFTNFFGSLGHAATPRDESVRQQVEFYPFGATDKDNPVILSFNGKLYDGNWLFEGVQQKQLNLTADEKFLVSVVSTNRIGSEYDVLSLWGSEERKEMQSTIFDRENFFKNRSFYLRIQESMFRAKIIYGSYILFLIQHSGSGLDTFVKTYPIVRVNSSYYLTNKLQSDPVYQYFSLKYAKQLGIVDKKS